MTYRQKQAEKIRAIRDEKGMKQIFVAKMAGITQAHLSRIENGESGVTYYTLKKIAKALGVRYDEIAVEQLEDTDPGQLNIEDVLADDTAMIRFMGGKRPDAETYRWVKRSLEIIHEEIKKQGSKKPERKKRKK